MNFGQAIKSGFQRYVDFNGRSSRSEYWYWVLFSAIVGGVLGFFQGIFKASGAGGGVAMMSGLAFLFDLAILLPSLAVLVRRLHDTDHSGWWYFIAFTVVGIIPLVIWLCTAGAAGANRFGDNPLAMPKTGPSTVNVWES